MYLPFRNKSGVEAHEESARSPTGIEREREDMTWINHVQLQLNPNSMISNEEGQSKRRETNSEYYSAGGYKRGIKL